MGYITLIKDERTHSWEIGFDETNNLEEHMKFKKEMLECGNTIDVKILKVEEVK
jgi:hypothetical protein